MFKDKIGAATGRPGRASFGYCQYGVVSRFGEGRIYYGREHLHRRRDDKAYGVSW